MAGPGRTAPAALEAAPRVCCNGPLPRHFGYAGPPPPASRESPSSYPSTRMLKARTADPAGGPNPIFESNYRVLARRVPRPVLRSSPRCAHKVGTCLAVAPLGMGAEEAQPSEHRPACARMGVVPQFEICSSRIGWSRRCSVGVALLASAASCSVRSKGRFDGTALLLGDVPSKPA